jgi:hypothetical protein
MEYVKFEYNFWKKLNNKTIIDKKIINEIYKLVNGNKIKKMYVNSLNNELVIIMKDKFMIFDIKDKN